MRNTYKIVVVTNKGRYTLKAKGEGKPSEICHEAKSLAGSIFHSPCVDFVKVEDKFGHVFLLLDKINPIFNENIPSAYADQV